MTGKGQHHRHATPEERTFFEALIELRARHAQRDADDEKPAIGVHEAIAFASAALAETAGGLPVRLNVDAF